MHEDCDPKNMLRGACFDCHEVRREMYSIEHPPERMEVNMEGRGNDNCCRALKVLCVFGCGFYCLTCVAADDLDDDEEDEEEDDADEPDLSGFVVDGIF